MKSNNMFRDHMNSVNSWFESWSECEQTVALYSLLMRATTTQCRFLSQVLSQRNYSDIAELEKEANESAYIHNLCNESKESAISKLLARLPLLHTGNTDAKKEYLRLIPTILSYSKEHGTHIEDTRQLLSYSLIHPACTSDERSQFTMWIGQLEEIFTYGINQHKTSDKTDINCWQEKHEENHHTPLHVTYSAPARYPMKPPLTRNHAPLTRTTSLVPPPSTLNVSINEWLSSSDTQINRVEHAPLSPQSSITSSGSSSDTHQEDGPQPVRNSFLEEGSGMRDVPMWLKTLRLHKYAYLFQQMTYEEMMTLTEEWLESQNVTKGARNKIILSIIKLKERQERLRIMEKEIMDGASLVEALNEMKSMLNSPLKAFNTQSESESSIAENDIPSQFTRTMGKVCTQLSVCSQPDDHCCNLYMILIEKCINHEAFTDKQKKLLASWKLQLQRIWQPLGFSKYGHERRNKIGWGNTFPMSMRGGISQKPVIRLQKSGPQFTIGPKRSIVGGTTSGHAPLQRNSSLNPDMFTQSFLLEHGKTPVTRTYSAPLRSAQSYGLTMTNLDQSSSDNAENYAQLDSLCLSVTEHALGSLDLNDR